MKIRLLASAIAILFVHINSARGDIIFSQDFSESTNIEDYADLYSPDSGQWNKIVTGSILNGGISYTRGTSYRGFTRSTDLPEAEALIFKFDINISGTLKKNNVAAWQLGSEFSHDLNAREANSKVHSQFALNFLDYSTYGFRNPVTSVDYKERAFGNKFTLTWVINNSGEVLEYTAPNNSMRTVAIDQWDLWCGPFPIFLGQAATTPGQAITDFKFSFTDGTGTIWMDNFSANNITAVPEPAATGVISAGLLGLLALVSKARQRRV